MEKWNEFRTAYHVAKYGTVSAAAEKLGVHRATIIRHIDSLEEELGGKIFFRNAKGYSLTEIGDDLLRVAEATEDQLKQFVGRSNSRDKGVDGELVVSMLDVVCETLMPGMQHFNENNPDSRIRCVMTPEVLRLEYGEAHVAIRSGKEPVDPDYVVLPLIPLDSGLYASESYLSSRGKPDSLEALPDHLFIGPDRGRSYGPYKWLNKNVKKPNYRVQSSSFHCRVQAVRAGLGLAFMPVEDAKATDGLVEILSANRAWRTKLWLVTHGATHRTAKVQAFIQSLRMTGYLDNKA
ncbi:MAG: LysR family transcriptional regulator [Pseudomonadota bacterium]